jgi:LysM domain
MSLDEHLNTDSDPRDPAAEGRGRGPWAVLATALLSGALPAGSALAQSPGDALGPNESQDGGAVTIGIDPDQTVQQPGSDDRDTIPDGDDPAAGATPDPAPATPVDPTGEGHEAPAAPVTPPPYQAPVEPVPPIEPPAQPAPAPPVAPAQPQPVAPPTGLPAPPPPAPPAMPAPAVPETPVAPVPAAPPTPEPVAAPRRDEADQEESRTDDAPTPPRTESSPAPAPAPAVAPAPVEAPALAAPVANVAAPAPGPAADGRPYVVQQGDTLWSIARRLLPAGASAAEIADLVDRIWGMNADAIGSGSPDLIMVGERLQLPVPG